MKLYHSLKNLNAFAKGSVVTLGNFDGVHRGHQMILEKLNTIAQEQALPSVLITFEPQPKEYFNPETAPARLTSLREKVFLLQQFSLQNLLCLRFNNELANLSAEDFISKILLEKLQVRHLLVGDDFRFGYQRKGDVALLHQYATREKFTISVLPKVEFGAEVISSTRIRTALKEGDLTEAAKLLGRPYSISGRVVAGDKRGRQLGFPTANIRLQRLVSPVHGVYAVRVKGYNNRDLYGVANIGSRPTIAGKQFLLETHIFDFNETIYGQSLAIELLQQIRSEKKFASLDELKLQIADDVTQAKAIIAALIKV